MYKLHYSVTINGKTETRVTCYEDYNTLCRNYIRLAKIPGYHDFEIELKKGY
jgi:hypothetical protein